MGETASLVIRLLIIEYSNRSDALKHAQDYSTPICMVYAQSEHINLYFEQILHQHY